MGNGLQKKKEYIEFDLREKVRSATTGISVYVIRACLGVVI